MTTSYNNILEQIYYDENHPAGFGGAPKLYQAAKLRDPQITLKYVKDWLSEQLVYTLHKQARKNWLRNKTIVEYPNEQFQADLVNMNIKDFNRVNNGYKYILTVIDVFSKYAWAIPLKDATGQSVKRELEKIFKERAPQKFQTDRGKEFQNKLVQDLFKKYNINYFPTYNTKNKCAVVERFNRTLKSKMFKYFTYTGQRKYWNVLPRIVDAYNHTIHRTTKFKPIDVNVSNQERVFYNTYGVASVRDFLKNLKPGKLEEGDIVRQRDPDSLNVFAKGYYPVWTDQTFHVDKSIKGTNQPLYIIRDDKGQKRIKRLYPYEIQKIKNPIYRIEVLNERRRRNQREVYVRYLGYPRSYNEWIPVEDLVNING